MTELALLARNTAPDSPNKIHTEEARRYGFEGGIVPGLTLYAYLVRRLVDHYGEAWLESGQLEVRFRRPVYDGDRIVVATAPDPDDATALALTIRNARDEVCVSGRSWAHRDRDVDPSDYPDRPYDGSPLVDGTPELMATLPELMNWEIDTSRTSVDDYLAEIEETNPIYRSILHPTVVARVSAMIVGRRFHFGPRIHAGLRTRFLATADRDAELTGRGRVARVWEKNGNQYLESDLLVVDAAGSPIMQIDSQSLYQLGAGPSSG